jgi:peptidyl-prolyl cis-trans isomerase C
MSFKPSLLLACTASLLVLGACTPKEQGAGAVAPAVSSGAVAATVNGVPISETRVSQIMKQRSQGQPENPEMRKALIDQMAMQIVVAQEAVKKGLDKTPEVADQMELTKQSILGNAYVQDYFKNANVTDDQLKAEYDKLKAQMGGTEYKARHILVEKEADAKDLIAKLKSNPKAFEALAKEKSKDPGSAANGGDLGWFDPRAMVPEFGDAVAKLPKGGLTEQPVKTQFGYHVIKLEDSRPAKIPALDEVKPKIVESLQQKKLQEYQAELKKAAKVDDIDGKKAAKADAADAKKPAKK